LQVENWKHHALTNDICIVKSECIECNASRQSSRLPGRGDKSS